MVSTTPLHRACTLGHANVVQLIDLDPNLQDGDGETAIYSAAQAGHVEVSNQIKYNFYIAPLLLQ